MSRKQKTETNVATAFQDLAYARRRVAGLKSGARREVRHGLLIDNTNRRGRRRSRVIDLPHYVVYKASTQWPGTDGRASASDRFVVVASTRDGFTSGAGVSPPDLSDIQPSPTDDKGLYREALVISLGGGGGSISLPHATARVAGDGKSVITAALSSDTAGWEGSPGQIVYMPMSPSRPLGAYFSCTGHWRQPVRLQISEGIIRSWLGAEASLVRRQFPLPSQFQEVYLYVFVPEFSVDHGAWGFNLAVPITRATSEELDHGAKSILFVFIAASPFSGAATGGSSYFTEIPLPDSPQFEQGEWIDEDGRLPSYIIGEVLRQPNGTMVYYGAYHGGVMPEDAEDDGDRGYITTLFSADEAGFFNVIRCTGNEPWLSDREVNRSDPELNPVYANPFVHRGAGDNWAVFRAYFGTGRMRNTGVSLAAYQEFSALTIVRGGSIVAEGLPSGTSLVGGVGFVTTGPAISTGLSARNELVCCHLDTPSHFGITFLVLVGNVVRLGRWDTLTGFGMWDFDLSEMDAGPQGQASITCYRKVGVTGDGIYAGDPGFIVGMAVGADRATFIITDGVARYCAPAFAAAIFPVGNKLTARGSTEEAYERPRPGAEE